MLTIVFVLWKQISCFYMLSIFLPVESFNSIRSSCVCIGDWDVRERRKKISQTSELLWLIMKWIYSIANLKVPLNSNNIIQNLTSFLFCHYSTEVLGKKNRPSSSVLGGKGGGQNCGCHLEFLRSYSEKLCVTRHWGHGLAVGQCWAPGWAAGDCSLAAYCSWTGWHFIGTIRNAWILHTKCQLIY